MSRWTLLTDELIHEISSSNTADEYLVLEPHPDFNGQWVVHCLNAGFYFDFKDVLGAYRALTPAKLGEFMKLAHDLEYKVVFDQDPTEILEAYNHLNDSPEIQINSDFPGTVNGLLPFQVQGFNFLKDLDSGVALWSTGCGKAVLATALLQYQLDQLDIAFVLCRAHNCINMQRMMKRLGDIDSVVVSGTKIQRKQIYKNMFINNNIKVIISNYEKLRVDLEFLLPLVEGRRVVFHWDEMPTKLRNRNTQLYRSVRRLLYRKGYKQQRPSVLRQYMYSATPIENEPQDFYNCIRLLNPELYGNVDNFFNTFVAQFDYFRAGRPVAWHNLEKMGAMAAHMVHQVNKKDPDIINQFPDVIEENLIIDWDKRDREIYDRVTNAAKTKLTERDEFEYTEILALISLMQMLCDVPSMVNESAALREVYETAMTDVGGSPIGSKAAWELLKVLGGELDDSRHTKLDILCQLLVDDHKDEKVVIFSTYNKKLLPILEKYLAEWGLTFVTYTGNSKQKQEAQDKFTEDPDVQVFLSSDAGSDSINLEVASVVINFDLPWKYSTLVQRQNRVHRITSTFSKVRYYRLLMADSIEERKLAIVKRKYAYQQAIFEKSGEVSISSRLSKQDLIDLLG